MNQRRLLPKGKNKKVIGLIKEELVGDQIYWIKTKRLKLTVVKIKKQKVIKRKLKFENYKNSLEATQLGNK